MDIVCGGSPCQDLSIAGLRAGLAGARSGLFMGQLRVIREMRDADRARGRTALAVRPRSCSGENVPGAFSEAMTGGLSSSAGGNNARGRARRVNPST